ncbi:hypothetical protein [Xenorhabdus koppenhoeferi]|uniref:Uncharacterized protein n=1 Tax=Xenorhabdus koppenhoeferi TaxID=351659 RepID=A0A1I7HB65_9GAMM|nr:hypothetical protein [Xenorhabdus koppenhoeferi]SFU57832.1 hypothetical protein SAMN05421784_11262 [Xenorhabdus koppenhoeferi]
MIFVTILMFSGEENYQWKYDTHSEESKRLLYIFHGFMKGINIGNHKDKLGFSGVLVEFDGETVGEAAKYGIPDSFYLCDGHVLNLWESQYIACELIESSNLNELLKYELNKMINNIKETEIIKKDTEWFYKDLIEDEDNHIIVGRRKFLHDVGSKGNLDINFVNPITNISYSVQTGLFSKMFWNVPGRIEHNNCYAYACNYASGTFPSPGRYSGKPHKRTIYSLIDAVIADGLIPLEEYKIQENTPNYVIALYCIPSTSSVILDNIFWDYHFYRLVVGRGSKHSQFWGHKPGQGTARKRDDKGKIIYDPNKCERGDYTEFAGYFIVSNQVKIK